MGIAPNHTSNLYGNIIKMDWENGDFLKHIYFDDLKIDRFLITEIDKLVNRNKIVWMFYTGTKFDTTKINNIRCISEGIDNRNLISTYEVDSNAEINIIPMFSDPISQFGNLKKYPKTRLVGTCSNVITSTKPECNHQWVNVGFSSVKIVCKKCDVEKP